jgi:hypothetical protein
VAILLDQTTKAEYNALSLASARASAVVSALTGTVVVEVYSGTDTLMASGTMAAPWATASGATITVGEVTGVGLLVATGGAPDANWYCQFRSGSRFIRGTFGVLGSGRDFVWSLASFQTGSRGTLGTVVMTATGAASAEPLLYEANVTGSGRYLGAFKVPSDGGQASPNNWTGSEGFEAGQYIAYNSTSNTLFITSRNIYGTGNIGQITIPTGLDTTGNPANMPTAAWSGTSTSAPYFFDITNGNRTLSSPMAGVQFVNAGMFTDDVNIYQSFENFYDNGGSTIGPLWKRTGLTLNSGTITGPVTWAGSKEQRVLAGAGCSIPSAWQTSFAGNMLQADKQFSINSTQNRGPFLSSWDKTQFGVTNPLPNTVLCDNEYDLKGSDPIWNATARCSGLMFPAGSRSILHVGTRGVGTLQYGTPGQEAEPDKGAPGIIYDPISPAKGYHAYPYRWYIWAYDANDLFAVKTETKASNTVLPYSHWSISAPPNTVNAENSITVEQVGSCYDNVNKRLFIAECGTSRTGSLQPIIHVYQLSF